MSTCWGRDTPSLPFGHLGKRRDCFTSQTCSSRLDALLYSIAAAVSGQPKTGKGLEIYGVRKPSHFLPEPFDMICLSPDFVWLGTKNLMMMTPTVSPCRQNHPLQHAFGSGRPQLRRTTFQPQCGSLQAWEKQGTKVLTGMLPLCFLAVPAAASTGNRCFSLLVQPWTG